jgi:hypothetical protein
MKRKLIVCLTTAALGISAAQSAKADGAGVAAGVFGGLAVGTILGAAAAQPRYAPPPPAYVYEPEPVYAPSCYWTHGRPVWDEYRGIWVRPRVRVCD